MFAIKLYDAFVLLTFAGWSAARESLHLRFTECRVFLFDQSLLITEDDEAFEPVKGGRSILGSFSTHYGHVVYGSESKSGRFWDPYQTSASGGVVGGAGGICPDVEMSTGDPQSPTPSKTGIPAKSTSPSYNGGRSPTFRRSIGIRRHPSNVFYEIENNNIGNSYAQTGASSSRFCSTSSDPFQQSAYKFMHSVKVNRMTFMVCIILSVNTFQLSLLGI